MIFVTVGTQAPFDRLIRAVDEITVDLNEEKIIVQSFGSRYSVKHMEMRDFIPPSEYIDIFSQARLIISHAGTGTIISALTMGKPIILMPRKASLGEHRNDHQLATVRKFKDIKNIYIANNEGELIDSINLINKKDKIRLDHFDKEASIDLITSVRNYLLKDI